MPEMRVQMVSEYTVISTFAGCGGSSLGYKWAGYKEVLAVEWDSNAVETFKLNFPEVPIYHDDIRNLSGKICLELSSMNKGELDIFDGSPPCQGFSLSRGKRNVCDPRNDLFLEYVRLIKELGPKIFIMENVSGMIKGKMKGKYLEIWENLMQLNYNVKSKLMNAMWYDVPQSRERMFFIGVRKDLNIVPSFPRPLEKVITVKEALLNVEVGLVPEFNDKYSLYYDKIKYSKSAQSIIGKGFNNCKKVHPEKPSPTLLKFQTGRGFATTVHYSEKRALSINEAKRLSSFPDDFKFIGGYSEQWARIGNSVMPKMMYHIAKHVKENILDCYYATGGKPVKL